MSTVKVFITVTSVEPRSNLDTKPKPTRTPRVLLAGEFYDVQEDVAQKLYDLKRAEEPGTPGVPTGSGDAERQNTKANTKISKKDAKAVKGAGGMPTTDTAGNTLGGDKDANKDAGKKAEAKADSKGPNEEWDMEELQDFAKKHKIHLTGARTKEAVLAKIQAAGKKK